MNKEMLLNIFMVSLVGVVVAVSGLLVVKNMHDKDIREQQELIEKQKLDMKNSQETDGTSKTIYKGKQLAGKTVPFLEFNKEDYDAAKKANKLIVLNFYANWCPICRGEAPQLHAGFDALKTENVIGFQVNYNDSETEQIEKDLAKEFSVTYQHTKVVVKNGKAVLKTEDTWTADTLVAAVNENLK